MEQYVFDGFEQPKERTIRVTISFETKTIGSDDHVRSMLSEPRVLRLFPFEGLIVERVDEVGEGVALTRGHQ